MYTIYAIHNSDANKVYIGQAMDITERLHQHNHHTFKGYTARFEGEWKLIYTESVATRSEALKREKQLKIYRGREFVKTYIPA